MEIALNITPLSEWFPGYKRPLIISGPCSAETEQQMQSTAQQLAKTGKVHALRAGIWKPRTRPNAFEGVGERGLEWLKAAGMETGLPVTTEVANAQHVELCLKHGIDILWIGARTTVNPFSVQEIANALRGVDIPVFVKNPVNPDIQLWIGALERINQAGIKRIAAIHRGFSSFEKMPFRNAPMWELPIELKTICPELDIICDPSHIAGNRELLALISQKALDLDMAGLMIESHITPESALSDAAQQVTPAKLSAIIAELTVRTSAPQTREQHNQLDELRAIIDGIDEELVRKLFARMQVVEKIGEYKRDNNITILQIKRWEEILSTRSHLAKALGLNEEFIRKFLQLIHKESIRKQTDVMNKSAVVE